MDDVSRLVDESGVIAGTLLDGVTLALIVRVEVVDAVHSSDTVTTPLRLAQLTASTLMIMIIMTRICAAEMAVR